MWAAGGHGSKGWTFAPGTGRLVADLVTHGGYRGDGGADGVLADDYAPNRFFSCVVYAMVASRVSGDAAR